MVTPVAPVKYPAGWPPPSTMPCTAPLTRSRVRTIRHGSTGLMRNTFACGPSAAMLSRAAGDAEKRVMREVAVVEHHHLDVIAVGSDELAAAVVEAHAVLRAAGLGAEVERARIE